MVVGTHPGLKSWHPTFPDIQCSWWVRGALPPQCNSPESKFRGCVNYQHDQICAASWMCKLPTLPDVQMFGCRFEWFAAWHCVWSFWKQHTSRNRMHRTWIELILRHRCDRALQSYVQSSQPFNVVLLGLGSGSCEGVLGGVWQAYLSLTRPASPPCTNTMCQDNPSRPHTQICSAVCDRRCAGVAEDEIKAFWN